MKQSEINKTISQKIKKYMRAWDYEMHCIRRASSASTIADISLALAELRGPGAQDLSPRTHNQIRLLLHDEIRNHSGSQFVPDPEDAARQKKILVGSRDVAEQDTRKALEDLENTLQALPKLQRARACLYAWEIAGSSMTVKRRLQEALKSSLLKKGEGDPVTLIVKPGFLVLSNRLHTPGSDLSFQDADSLDQAFRIEDTGTHCIGMSRDRNGRLQAWSAPIEQRNKRKNIAWTGSPVAMSRAIKVEIAKSA